MAHDEHAFDVVFLVKLFLRHEHGIEPARGRNARHFHHLDCLAIRSLARIEAARHPFVIDFPDAAPMLPGIGIKPVVEGQRYNIETHIGRALHIAMAPEDVCPGTGCADIAGCEQCDAGCADVRRSDGLLGLPHAPDQRGRLLFREHFRNPAQLLAGNARNPLDFLRIPFRHFLAHVVHAVDACFDEVFVLPAILKNVPEHSPKDGDVGAGPDADIFSGVSRCARQARIDDN